MAQLFTNNALATLASGITNVATSATLSTGTGALFPNPSGGDYFQLTLTQASTETSWEIVTCTARSGDVLTITRAQEGTSAAAWSTGDKAELRVTAAALGGKAASGANSDITSLSGLTTPISLIALSSYLSGCTLSTAGSSATMSIAAGAAMDSTNAYLMQLVAIAKTTSAWSVGTAAGGIDTGAIANSTWYHFYVIRRPDTGIVDVVFSTSASSPTLPTNYTQYRRIGSGKTNGSAQWTSFTQDGDYFRLAASALDINTNNPGTAAVTATLASVPTGINAQAIINAGIVDTSGSNNIYFSDLSATDEAPSSSAAPLSSVVSPAANVTGYGMFNIRTNTSAQIRYRALVSTAATTVRIATLGWIDRRGREA